MFDRRKHLLRVGKNTRFKPHKIKRNCDYCGREYERIPSQIGRFCSYGCSNRFFGEQRKGKCGKRKGIYITCQQ